MSSTTAAQAPSYTDEQRRAVETRAVSVSLSAGAGCGKTFVLTERYLSHFDPHDPEALRPEDIGRLVAITFTDRAARDMRDRIRQRCYERLLACPADDAPYWAEMLRALDGAKISTIHAYCASLLRSRAVEAGLDPQFAVLEQSQSETILSEAVDDALRERVAEREENTLSLAVRFGLNDLRAIVRQFVAEWSPEAVERFLGEGAEALIDCWVQRFELVRRQIVEEFNASRELSDVLEVLREELPAGGVARDRCDRLLESFEVMQNIDIDALAAVLNAIHDDARVVGTRKSDWPSEDGYTRFRDAAKRLRKLVKEFQGVLDFEPAAAREAAEVGLSVLDLAAAVYAEYESRKQELRVLDFNDLLIRARALLTDPAHADAVKQLSDHLVLLLVDEFQDTDPVQVELLEALCGAGVDSGKLFFVGDHKQSIYRFRGADPHVFRRLSERTPPQGRQKLSLNFRSQPAILQFVNALFWDDVGPEYQPLRAHRPQVSPEPAVEFLWAPSPTGDKESAAQTRHREAEWIARRLRALFDEGEPIVWDEHVAPGEAALRGARPGDVAILFRALSDVEAYEAALRRYEIDYYLVGGHAFYAQQEIFDLLNLLRVLNSPADAVSLIGVLRSPMFSLSDETIFWLSRHPAGLGGGLHADVFPSEIPPDQQQRAAHAAQTLRRLGECKDRLRISELIEMAFALTGYDSVVLGEFLGDRTLANLVKLQERARGFQRGDFLGLSDFIAQLSEFVAGQPDEPLAATHSENANVVRLMTIHQSKGLEFPLVVVPDVDRRQNTGARSAHLDTELGPLVRLANGSGDHCPTSGHDLWAWQEKEEEAREANRVLYVATTRAADYLILSGGVRNLGDDGGPWTKLLASRFDLLSGRFVGRLPEGEPRPAIRVTTEEPAVEHRGTGSRRRVDVAKMVDGLSDITPAPAPRAFAPIARDASAPRQYSFSRLAGTLEPRYERLNDAAFFDQPSDDPRSLGTLVHAALAAIDFRNPPDSLREMVEFLAEQHLPDRPAEVAEAVAMVERFAVSQRAGELAAAQACHAEVEFLLAWPPERLFIEASLAGFIDRLYQDAAGNWHVLDFKTNRVSGSDVAREAAAYEMQMFVYGLATERILGAPPASLRLHFLRNGAEHAFAWDARARNRVVSLVGRAIAAARQGVASGE